MINTTFTKDQLKSLLGQFNIGEGSFLADMFTDPDLDAITQSYHKLLEQSPAELVETLSNLPQEVRFLLDAIDPELVPSMIEKYTPAEAQQEDEHINLAEQSGEWINLNAELNRISDIVQQELVVEATRIPMNLADAQTAMQRVQFMTRTIERLNEFVQGIDGPF